MPKEPQRQPKEPSTRRQLRTIRSTLTKLKLRFKERYAAADDASFFTLVFDGPEKLSSVHLVHGPGLLTIYGVFGVRPKKSQLAEVLRFANIVNETSREGTLMVRDDASVVYRAAVNYSRVKDLEAGYVAGLVATLLDAVDPIDLPLILVAKGSSAQAAVKRCWVSTKAQRFA